MSRMQISQEGGGLEQRAIHNPNLTPSYCGLNDVNQHDKRRPI